MKKFKVGDRIRIINGVYQNGVPAMFVGSQGTIVSVHYSDYGVKVHHPECTRPVWYMQGKFITNAAKIGEQLLFDFMKK